MTDYFGNLTVLNGAAAGEADDEYEDEVQYHLRQIRAKDEAKRRYEDDRRAAVGMPQVRNLTTLLAEPDTETVYRIEGLASAGARVMLAAQAKSGKTHLAGNLVRSLVDGDPFLGRFRVSGQSQRVAIVDTELSQNMLRRWLREQGIVNTDRVDVIALRGRVGAFNLLNPDRRAEWAEVLRDVDFLILDCLRPVLDAIGLDEHRDAGKFLVAFDALLAQAGITDAMLVHHMGHTGDRARGDSRLQDWPDVTWRILRAKDDPDSDRFFTAYGRDVEVPEGRLDFDPTTRRLTYADGSRKADTRQAAREEILGEIVGILTQRLTEGNPDPMSHNDIVRAATEQYNRSARTIRPALEHGVIQGVLTKANGPRNSHLYTLTNPCTVCHRPVPDLTSQAHPDCDTNDD